MKGGAGQLTLKDIKKTPFTRLSRINKNVTHASSHTHSFRKYIWMKVFFVYFCFCFCLVVLGEASAGKSSLINLILGERLLPSSSLSTTSTLCELKYGEERKIVAHLKDTDSKTGLTSTIFLENPTESSGKSYLQQISPFVHVKGADRGKGTIYKKVEIFWPHQLLKVSIQLTVKCLL